jgi:hypothetical protein
MTSLGVAIRQNEHFLDNVRGHRLAPLCLEQFVSYAHDFTLDPSRAQFNALLAAGCQKIVHEKATVFRTDRPGLAKAIEVME